MKKLIFPVAIILMGAGAAFATKAAASKTAIVDGYRIDAVSGQCINVEQPCNTLGVEACTWAVDGTTHLQQLEDTMCGNELFKP